MTENPNWTGEFDLSSPANIPTFLLVEHYRSYLVNPHTHSPMQVKFPDKLWQIQKGDPSQNTSLNPQVRNNLSSLYKLIDTVIINDSFGSNDGARNAWQQKTREQVIQDGKSGSEFWELFNRSLLRANIPLTAITPLYLLKRLLPETDIRVGTVSQTLNFLDQNYGLRGEKRDYDLLDTKDKEKIALKFLDHIVEILNSF